MKSICLYNPPSPWLISDKDLVPLGILYLSSYLLDKGFDVKLVDLSGDVFKTDYHIPEADIYGIGFVSPQFTYAKEILKKIKTTNPNAKVIAGGIHATSMPQQVLNAGFDAVVRGEGELSVERILNKGIEQKIYNLNFIKNINELPMPAYRLLDMNSYVKNLGVMTYMKSDSEEEREVNIMGTRGCNHRCTYCSMYKGPTRWRTPRNIIKEIRFLQKNYGVNRISFCDDSLAIDNVWLRKLCKELKKTGIKWHCLARTDQVDYHLCKVMKNAGCMGIDFGIETGSQRMLDIIRKDTTIKVQERGIKAAYNAGIKVRAQIMIGLPQETEEDFQQTFDFIKRNDKYVTKWGVHTFIPYPCSPIWHNPEKFGYKINKDTDFSNYQTIGKPGEWNFIPKENAEQIERWRNTLLDYINQKNIFITIEVKKND